MKTDGITKFTEYDLQEIDVILKYLPMVKVLKLDFSNKFVLYKFLQKNPNLYDSLLPHWKEDVDVIRYYNKLIKWHNNLYSNYK